MLVWAFAACKGKGKGKEHDKGAPAGTAELEQRCEQLAKACGDTDKHVEAILGECKQAVKKQVANGCISSALAEYDCYQKQLCGKADKVWAFDDLRVLVDRNGTCAAERKVARECVGQ